MAKSKKVKIRPMSDIMFDVEDIVTEMIETHDLQHGEVLSLVKGYLDVHFPESIEEYEDGSNPVYYYGHKKSAKKILSKLK